MFIVFITYFKYFHYGITFFLNIVFSPGHAMTALGVMQLGESSDPGVHLR